MVKSGNVHPLVSEMIDDRHRDAAGLGFVEGAERVAVEGFACFFVGSTLWRRELAPIDEGDNRLNSSPLLASCAAIPPSEHANFGSIDWTWKLSHPGSRT